LLLLIKIAAFKGASCNSPRFSPPCTFAEAIGSPVLVAPSLVASYAALLVSAGAPIPNSSIIGGPAMMPYSVEYSAAIE